MTALPRFIAPGLLAPALLMAAGVQPAFASVPDPALPSLIVPLTAGVLEELPRPLPDPVRAMIDAALASGEGKDIEIVVSLAKATNPKSVGEIEAILAAWQAQHESKPEPDPIRQMLAAAMATRKDGDVEAVGALAKKTNPERIADIDAMLVDYRAKRTAEKKAAADAARAKLAAAKFWQNWKGEGQIGASQSSGNTSSTGLSLGLALNRKGIDWDQRFRAQADYQRTGGSTSMERYLVEYEPQIRVGERAFAYGLGRWERDRILGFGNRWNASAGMGYKVIANKAMTLNLKAGPAWRETDYLPGRGQNESELTGLAGLDFGWNLSPTLRLTQTASTIVGQHNSVTSSLTALNAKLTGALSARFSYSADIDTRPPPGIEKVDTLTRFTLVYGF
jgi:putative salt-induced outer membrane protein